MSDIPDNKFVAVDGAKVQELMDINKLSISDIVNLTLIGKRTLMYILSQKKPNRRDRESIVSLAKTLNCDINILIDHAAEAEFLQSKGVPISLDQSSPGERRFRESIEKYSGFMNDILVKLKKSNPDHMVMYMLAGLNERIGELLRFNGASHNVHMVMPHDYYPACLEGVSAADCGTGIEAIAELSDSIEQYLWHNPDPDKTLIAQRIFLVPPQILLNPNAFGPTLRMLQQQVEMYPVRVGVTRQGEMVEHPLGETAIGRNLILLEPNLVGGYVKEGRKVYLKIVSDDSVYARARSVYDKQVSDSLELKQGDTAEDVRRAYVEKEKLGVWEESWGGTGEKTDKYIMLYDENIRCFVPNYDRMIHNTSKIIQSEILRLVRGSDHPLNILEVGSGTGGLTKPLLTWIDGLNAPCSINNHSSFVGSYTCLDKSSQMLDGLKLSLENAIRTHHTYIDGSFEEQTLSELPYSNGFDVIVGSLVLHDLLEGNPGDLIDDFFSLCKKYLAHRGSIVFADTFVESPDEVNRWKSDMTRIGMSDERIKTFIDLNPEMINTVTKAQLAQSAAEHGLMLCPMIIIPSFTGGHRPFKIMVVRTIE